MTQGKLGIIVGILLSIAGFNIYNVAHPKTAVEKTTPTIIPCTTTTPKEFEITITATKLPTKETKLPAEKTTPGETQYLYVIRNGKATKVYKGIKHKMGFRWFSEDGEKLYFLPAKKESDYKLYKKRQEHLDREILGY